MAKSLGMSKHRKSGHNNKSPKLKHTLKRDAELNDVKAKNSNCKEQTVSELFNG